MTTKAVAVLITLLLCHTSTYAADDEVVVEDFAVSPNMDWQNTDDTRVGGQSIGSVLVADGLGKLSGEVKNWEKVNGPGFVGMVAKGTYPDLSTCEGLEIYARPLVPYEGFALSFSTGHSSEASEKYGHRGYRAPFKFENNNSFERVKVSFLEFSDLWDASTGKIITSCTDDHRYCPNRQTLRDLIVMGVWAEGQNGVVDLEVKSIKGYDCGADNTNSGDLFKSAISILSNPNRNHNNNNGESKKTSDLTIAAISMSGLAVFTSFLAVVAIWRTSRMQPPPKVETKPAVEEATSEDQTLVSETTSEDKIV